MSTLSITNRPETLEDVVGNESTVAALKKQLSERVPSAMMFSGPPGVGKTTLAKIVAKVIGAEEINEWNGADRNGVDDARALADSAEYRPLSGQYKVYLIDEAQQMTPAAQQCLLLPLEAKESSTVWIFCTTDPQKLLPALKSRCLHYVLKPMGRAEISELIRRTESVEKLVAEHIEFVDYLVSAGVGSPREILMAYEKWSSGIPLKECLTSAEHEPMYSEVARATLQGDWNKTRSLLKEIKTADSRGLQSVVAAFFGSALLECGVGVKADALSGCLLAIGQQTFQDGIAYQTLRAALYRMAKQIGAKA